MIFWFCHSFCAYWLAFFCKEENPSHFLPPTSLFLSFFWCHCLMDNFCILSSASIINLLAQIILKLDSGSPHYQLLYFFDSFTEIYLKHSKHHMFKVHRTSLAVQWLRLHTSKAVGAGLIPDQGTKIPHAWPKK